MKTVNVPTVQEMLSEYEYLAMQQMLHNVRLCCERCKAQECSISVNSYESVILCSARLSLKYLTTISGKVWKWQHMLHPEYTRKDKKEYDALIDSWMSMYDEIQLANSFAEAMDEAALLAAEDRKKNNKKIPIIGKLFEKKSAGFKTKMLAHQNTKTQ